MPDGRRYDDDFYAWTQHQAQVLRDLCTDDNHFDREHLAEEIEDWGENQRNAVRRQVRRIIVHILKLAYSPAADPRPSWRGSVTEARAALEDDLSRSLTGDIEPILDRLYAQARKQALSELALYDETAAARLIPVDCPYSLDQILQEDWYPDPVQEQK